MRKVRSVSKPPSAADLKLIADGLATPKEACAFLRVGRNWVYGLMRAGALTHVRYGKRYAIPWKSLHEYAAAKVRRGTIA